jgi:hypothetical protein
MAEAFGQINTSNSISRYNMSGWYSRLIYIYNGANLDEFEKSESTNIFDTIAESRMNVYTKGTHVLPNGYLDHNPCIQWEIEGCFLYSGSSANGDDIYLQMGITNSDATVRIYESTIELSSDALNSPVHFKFNLIHGADDYFMGTGQMTAYTSGNKFLSSPIKSKDNIGYLYLRASGRYPVKFFLRNRSSNNIKIQHLSIKEFGT